MKRYFVLAGVAIAVVALVGTGVLAYVQHSDAPPESVVTVSESSTASSGLMAKPGDVSGAAATSAYGSDSKRAAKLSDVSSAAAPSADGSGSKPAAKPTVYEGSDTR